MSAGALSVRDRAIVRRTASSGSQPRILLVGRGFPPRGRWGTEFYMHQLAVGLRRHGWRVHVMHSARSLSGRAEVEEVHSDGFPVTVVRRTTSARKPFAQSYRDAHVEGAFRDLLRRERPDIVHFTHLIWTLSARLPLVAREAGVPTVLTLTDYGLLCHRGQLVDGRSRACAGPEPGRCARCVREPGPWDGPGWRVTAKRAAARALASVGGLGLVVTSADFVRRRIAMNAALAALDRLVAPTRELKRTFEAHGVQAGRILELVYALDAAPYEVARAVPTDPTVRIGFLSQFAPHKGAGTLLEAVRRLRERRLSRPYAIHVYGLCDVGRHRHYPRAVLARDVGPEVLVCLPYDAVDAPRVLAPLSAVVLPSEWSENAPLSALQARAAGVPIIASDVPGLAEIVADGPHGRLFPAGDAGALADRLADVIERGPVRLPAGLPLSLDEHVGALETEYASLGVRAPARAVRTVS